MDDYRSELQPGRLFEMSEDQLQQIRDYLDTEHGDLVKDDNVKVELVCGLEFVLQALGTPGYEWS